MFVGLIGWWSSRVAKKIWKLPSWRGLQKNHAQLPKHPRGWLFLSKNCILKEFKSESMRIIWAHGRATLASKPSKWTQVEGANQAQRMKGNSGNKQIFEYVQQSKKNQAKPTQTAKYQGKASMLASKRSKAKRWASRASKEASQPFGQLACQPTNHPIYQSTS